MEQILEKLNLLHLAEIFEGKYNQISFVCNGSYFWVSPRGGHLPSSLPAVILSEREWQSAFCHLYLACHHRVIKPFDTNNNIFIIEHAITPIIFHQLGPEDLRVLCPIIGQRYLLEQEQLNKPTQNSNYCRNKSNDCQITNNSCASSGMLMDHDIKVITIIFSKVPFNGDIYRQCWWFLHVIFYYLIYQGDLRKILAQFRKGKLLLSHFDRVGRLDSKHRSHLAECIVDYYLVIGNGKILREDFEKVAGQIVELFPCEFPVCLKI